MQTYSSAEVRSHNASLIIQLLWREKSLSRAELSRQTGLSRSTVSAICEELAERELTRDLGTGPSNGGKPPQMIGFREDAYALIGIDLGASHTTALVADLRGQVLASHSLPSDSRDQPYQAIEKANACLAECMEQVGFDWRRVVGVGVGVPCPVNPEEPLKLSSRVLPKWQDVDYLDLLAIPTGVPVFVDNDANLGGLAELWWGSGEEPRSLVFIKASVGVGAGLVIGGEVYRGANAWAGELGHIVIDPSGPRCDCGRVGCLVAFIGQRGLLAQYSAAAPEHEPQPATTHDLIALAEGGSEPARDVLHKAGEYLGAAVTNMLHVLNPNHVIVGGALALAGEHLLRGVREALVDQARWTSELDYEVRTSALGESATALGAATQPLSVALRQPELFTVRESLPVASRGKS